MPAPQRHPERGARPVGRLAALLRLLRAAREERVAERLGERREAGRQGLERQLLRLLVGPHQAADAGELQVVGGVLAREPQHAAVGVGLEAEALDDAVGERLEGERREQAEAPLVEREGAHELEVLGHQPGVLFAQPAALQDALEGARQHGAVDRLQQVVGRAELHGVDGGLHVADARDHDDVLLRAQLLDALHELGAVHARHHEVGQHHVEVAALEEVQRLFASRSGDDLVALLGQEVFEEDPEVELVIDGEDARLGHRPPESTPSHRPDGRLASLSRAGGW